MHYSSYFKIPHREFVQGGIFDGLTQRDIALHVDPLLLKVCKIPEFDGAVYSDRVCRACGFGRNRTHRNRAHWTTDDEAYELMGIRRIEWRY